LFCRGNKPNGVICDSVFGIWWREETEEGGYGRLVNAWCVSKKVGHEKADGREL